MKTSAVKIAIACMAVVLFLTGTGTTVIDFCCTECQDKLFSFQRSTCQTKEPADPHKSCCKKKQNTASEKKENCKKNRCCKIERKTIDLDSSYSRLSIVNPFTWIFDITPYFRNIYNLQFTDTGAVIQVEDPPPIKNPRHYLALIRILII